MIFLLNFERDVTTSLSILYFFFVNYPEKGIYVIVSVKPLFATVNDDKVPVGMYSNRLSF